MFDLAQGYAASTSLKLRQRPLSYLSYESYLDTKYDRYDKYDSYCAIRLPSDFFSNLTIISLSKAVEFNFVVLF